MCLVAIAIDQSRRFPLVLAGNRDEYYERPAQRLGWWSPGDGAPDILGGRDLHAGGTWLGLTAHGRLALVTNVRDPSRHDAEAPSRGDIVPLWLRGELSMDRFWTRIALAGYNGFNVVAADFARGECFWAGNTGALPVRLERGLWGVSNAALDTPWPKVHTLKARLREAVDLAPDADALADRLFAALADRTPAPDDALPSTGVPVEIERALSPAFIRMPQRSYGTRCSTVIVAERVSKRLVTHVFERTFTPGSPLALLRRVALRDWPPRYLHTPEGWRAAQEDVAESQVAAHHDGEPHADATAPRRRQRTLLAPAAAPRRRT